MMSLLFLLITAAMLALIMGRAKVVDSKLSDAKSLYIKTSYICFGVAFVLSLYWFSYHASQQLDIIL